MHEPSVSPIPKPIRGTLNLTQLEHRRAAASHQPWLARNGAIEISFGTFNQYWKAIGGFEKNEDTVFVADVCNAFEQMLEIIKEAKNNVDGVYSKKLYDLLENVTNEE